LKLLFARELTEEEEKYGKVWKRIFCWNNLRIVLEEKVVGKATCFRLDGPGIEFPWGAKFSAPVQTGPEAHPDSYTMGTESLSRG